MSPALAGDVETGFRVGEVDADCITSLRDGSADTGASLSGINDASCITSIRVGSADKGAFVGPWLFGIKEALCLNSPKVGKSVTSAPPSGVGDPAVFGRVFVGLPVVGASVTVGNCIGDDDSRFILDLCVGEKLGTVVNNGYAVVMEGSEALAPFDESTASAKVNPMKSCGRIIFV
jgi:hypothetical protein